jgi:transcriptional regulator with XRE-family HTH domain
MTNATVPPDAAAALAAAVRRLRVAARLSLSELARATGVGKATLSTIENGRGNPTVDTLAALAAALEVPVSDLFGVSEPSPVRLVRAGGGEPAGDGLTRLGRMAATVGADLLVARFEPRRELEAEARTAGARLHVVVTEGALETGPLERVTQLGPGDYLSFLADVPHLFRTARRAAGAVLVVEAEAAR